MANSRVILNPNRLREGEFVLEDGRVVSGLVQSEVDALELRLRRYFAWEASGRTSDPWASGVGQGQRYDRPRVIHGPPPGGYGPGTCSMPEPDASLTQMADQFRRLADHQQAILRWHLLGNMPMTEIAERLDVTRRAASKMLTTARVLLWYRLV